MVSDLHSIVTACKMQLAVCHPVKESVSSKALTVMQIAGMKLDTDSAPPAQRHSAPTPSAAAAAEGPVTKDVTAALRQSAPVIKVPCHDLTLEQSREFVLGMNTVA